MTSPVRYSVGFGLLVGFGGIAFSIIAITVGILVHAPAIAVGVVSGVLFFAATMVASFKARTRLKRRIDDVRGERR
jgi:hypothetical protein